MRRAAALPATASRGPSSCPSCRSSTSSRHTACAAGSEKEPTKTPRRRNTACSSVPSWSCVHDSAAASVCWRAGALRSPPVSTRKRSCSAASSCAGDSAGTRAAAISMASGRPSSRRATLTTGARLCASSTKWRSRARTRATKSCTAVLASAKASVACGSGSDNGSRRYNCSAVRRSGAWLVTSRPSPGQAVCSALARASTPSSTCSALSSTSSNWLGPSADASALTDPPRTSVERVAAATASTTPASSRTDVRSTHAKPSAKRGAAAWATWRASVDLPTPPAPSSVTSRCGPSIASSSARSASRPMSAGGAAATALTAS